MTEHEPLTKKERVSLAKAARDTIDRGSENLHLLTSVDLLRMEATIAACEVEIARLCPLVEAVEGMAEGWVLEHRDIIGDKPRWRVWDCFARFAITLGEGSTALAALTAAKGE